VDDSPVYTGEDPIKRCIKENVWDAIDKSISHVANSVTLADLANEYRRMRGNAQEYIT
jgi:DNA-binding IscR family transcriptional regulator